VYFFNNSFNQVNGIVGLLPNYDGDSESPFVPKFNNVYVANVSARYGKYGVRIHGWSDEPIRDVSLVNVSVAEVSEPDRELQLFNAERVFMKNVSLGSTRISKRMFNVVDTSYSPIKFK
jgi:hypothetical protein